MKFKKLSPDKQKAKMAALSQISDMIQNSPDFKDYDSMFSGTDEDFNNQVENDGSDLQQKFSKMKKSKK